jgi:hypothetical protein
MTEPQVMGAQSIFEAWLALRRIETPSPRVKEISRELRHALSDMGFRIERAPGTAALQIRRKLRSTI